MDLTDLPEHTRVADIKTFWRAQTRAAAKEVVAGSAEHALANDHDRRAMFMSEVVKRVISRGTSDTAAYLQRVYKFKRKVAYAIIKEARSQMAAQMATQTDELRAIAEARLEAQMLKADAACDLTNYGRALKEWMRLHGLYRQDDTTMGDFAAVIKKVTEAADAKTLGIIQDAEFSVKEDEPEETWNVPDDVVEDEE